jgi:hypothetical protein
MGDLLLVEAVKDGVLMFVEGLALEPHALGEIAELCELSELVASVNVFGTRIILVGDDQRKIGDGALDEEGSAVTEQSHKYSLPNIVSQDVAEAHSLLREGQGRERDKGEEEDTHQNLCGEVDGLEIDVAERSEEPHFVSLDLDHVSFGEPIDIVSLSQGIYGQGVVHTSAGVTEQTLHEKQ